MNLNQFMHKRNIYRKKHDFKQLGAEFPDFGQHLKFYPTGRATLDFEDPEALRCLTKTLLKKDFLLDVDIPANRLVPAIPQRLNYVLWVEDLVALLDVPANGPVVGIDVGTGPCCVFPLLGCRNNPSWRFIGTDVDEESLDWAKSNLLRNQMEGRVQIFRCSSNESLLTEVVATHFPASGEMCHFLMSNPPFFGAKFEEDADKMALEPEEEAKEDEKKGHKKGRRRKGPSAANTSHPTETVAAGGEVDFVKQIITESLILRDKVCIYSVMLGKKKSLLQLRDIIESHSDLITGYTTTELCQGNTMRWGIAWTFLSSLHLNPAPKVKHSKPKPPMSYSLPHCMTETEFTLQALTERIKSLLTELGIDSYDVIRESKHSVEIWMNSNHNSWSHQRRKRRIVGQKGEEPNNNNSSSCSMEGESRVCLSSESTSTSSPIETVCKRKLDDWEEGDESEVDEFVEKVVKRAKDVGKREEEKDEEKYLLHCSLVLKKVNKSIVLKMDSKEKARSRETTHQLFQYFKNKLI